MLNGRRCCPGLIAGKACNKAGLTLVVAAFTRRLRPAHEERTAHLSSSVSPVCVLRRNQTSMGRRARLACDLRHQIELSVKGSKSKESSAGRPERPAEPGAVLGGYRMSLTQTSCAMRRALCWQVLCRLSHARGQAIRRTLERGYMMSAAAIGQPDSFTTGSQMQRPSFWTWPAQARRPTPARQAQLPLRARLRPGQPRASSSFELHIALQLRSARFQALTDLLSIERGLGPHSTLQAWSPGSSSLLAYGTVQGGPPAVHRQPPRLTVRLRTGPA